MTVRSASVLMCLTIGLGVGCEQDHGHDHSRDHGGDPAHDHGRDHDHGGEDDGPEPVSVTVWTEKLELFVEFPPLVVGRSSAMHAHFTDLSDFSSLDEGTVRLALVDGGPGGDVLAEDSVDAPIRPGIFNPAVTPTRAGELQLRFDVTAPGLTDQIVFGVVVTDSPEEDGGDDEAGVGEISFLKEDQWKVPFATAVVGEGALTEGVLVNATVKAAAGREVWITAPADGRIAAMGSDGVLAPGMDVAENETLAVLMPLPGAGASREGAGADLVAARTALELATAEAERLRPLVEKGAVPASRLREAEGAVSVASARVRAASATSARVSAALGGHGGRSGSFQLKSPVAGTVVEVHVTPGATVGAGDRIARVIDLRRVWLEGRVHEADVPRLATLEEVFVRREGEAASHRVPLGEEPEGARLVNIGDVVDPTTRTVPVLVEVSNASRTYKIGGYLRMRLPVGEPLTGPVIPLSAIVHDRARPVAFVHVSGEAFERRLLSMGPEADGVVLIRDGVRPGERIVTIGAYEVLLASRATGEVHGHTH